MIRVMVKRLILVVVVLFASQLSRPVRAAEEFPFGSAMTLDAPARSASGRIPNLEIGDQGEVRLELWCKSGKGQFSVAGDTVVFVAGAMDERTCTPAQTQADDALLAALAGATNWSRQDDVVSFTGPKTLRFRLNTN